MVDRNPFQELQEGQVSSVQFNAPPLERVGTQLPINAGQNAQTLLFAGRYLNAGANQLEAITNKKIKEVDKQLEAGGQQLAILGTETLSSQELTGAGLSDTKFIDGYLKARADVDLKNLSLDIKSRAATPNISQDYLKQYTEEALGKVRERYNSFGSVGSNVFSDSIYKPALDVVNEAVLTGFKNDVKQLQDNQVGLVTDSLFSTFSSINNTFNTPDGLNILGRQLQESYTQLDSMGNTKEFSKILETSALRAVREGTNPEALKLLFNNTVITQSDNSKVSLSSLVGDLDLKITDAHYDFNHKVIQARRDQYGLARDVSRNNTDKIAMEVATIFYANNGNIDVQKAIGSSIQRASQQGATFDASELFSIQSKVSSLIDDNTKRALDIVKAAAQAGQPYPDYINKNVSPLVIPYLRNSYTVDTTTRNERLQDRASTLEDKQRKFANYSYDGLKGIGEFVIADPKIAGYILPGAATTNLAKGLNQTLNAASAGLSPTTDANTYNNKLDSIKTKLFAQIDSYGLSKEGSSYLKNSVNNFFNQRKAPITEAIQSGAKRVTGKERLSYILNRDNLEITSKYGMRTLGKVSRMHEGVDVAGKEGEPIRAPESGTITYSGSLGGYGNLVKLQSGKTEHSFGHCSRLAVPKGSTVVKGQIIGYVGSTGRSTGPHLHYEERINGVLVNPLR